MIGTLVGTILPLVMEGIAQKKQADEASKADSERARQQQQIDALHERRANEDPMSLSSVQAALNTARDMGIENIRAARGRAAVLGGGEQEMAAAQQSLNKAVGDMGRDIASTATARHDAAEEQYQADSTALSNARIAEANQRNANIANAASQGIAAGLQMIGADAQARLDTGRGMFGDNWSQWLQKQKENAAFNKSARQYRNNITAG